MVVGSIDNPVKLLICVLIVLAILIVLFKFQNWMDGRPVKEKKSKAKKEEPKKEVIKETIKETIKEDTKNIAINIDKDEIVREVKEQVYSEIGSSMPMANTKKISNCSNYLYDRFVDSPTIDDNVQDKKAFDAFLTDDEANNIKDRNVKVEVKDVEDISSRDIKKDKLYKKIQEMANENIESKEQMLKEFESLPKSVKLLLIENIMQKM